MVSTRHHPRDFPPPDLSPQKSSPRKSSRLSSTPGPDNTSLTKRAPQPFDDITVSPASSPSTWSHTTPNLTLVWLLISIPLVLWDVSYILLRPHTFSGGKLQWPIWKLYEIYAKFDLVYGPEAWERSEGFGGAQGAMNAVELVFYIIYAWMVVREGRNVDGGREGVWGWIRGGRRVEGRTGNRAVLLGFAAAVMTCSKTVLYYLNEYFSGFANIRHNDWVQIVELYGVMNGLWVLVPTYMIYVFGKDILSGLDLAVESQSDRKEQ